jgi:hypothetical protein
MKMKKQWLHFLALAIVIWIGFVFPLSAWGEDRNPEVKQVADVIKRKERAVNQNRIGAFLALLNPELDTYVHEQKRWFQDAVQYIDPGSFRLHVLSLEKESGNAYRATVSQSYKKDGRLFQVKYPLLIKKTERGWVDSDLPFHVMAHGPIVVRYSHPALKEQAHIALDVLKRALYVLKRRMEWSPEKVEVKLYHDAEMFRQSVKPSLPAWAGGWHEANQAIKFIGGISNHRSFASGMVHELTHQMVSEQSGDNAAYWLQEGAAMYYEAHLLPGLHEGHPMTADDGRWMSIAELEKTSLEKLPDREALRYYLSCYHQFRRLVEGHGEGAWRRVLRELRKNPYLDVDSNQKMDTANRLTREALRRAVHSIAF